MKNPRTVGLALILLGVMVLLGNTTEALPPEAFFAGLVLYPIGGFLFFKGSRAAINRAEARAANIRRPRLANERAEQQADRQLQNINDQGSVDERMHSLGRVQEDARRAPPSPQRKDERFLHEIDADLGEEDETFSVTTDVSFPIEIQEQDSIAEQITKLHKLREDGVISEEEMAIAKAKLFG